jgi:uncharacterized protein
METLIKTEGVLTGASITAFDGMQVVMSGTAMDVITTAKKHFDADQNASMLVFDDATGDVIDIDFRGDADRVIEIFRCRAEMAGPTAALRETLVVGGQATGPGRPRLGVVAREVTLLPRHWNWLNCQPGGASVALRKLVEEARKNSSDKDRVRQAQEAAYKFMSAIAGDLPGYEEALRALFACDSGRFQSSMQNWPIDVSHYANKLAAKAFTNSGA